MADAYRQENQPVNVWPPTPTVEPPTAPAKKPSVLQRLLAWTLVYLFASALCFGGFLAANSFTSWEEDKPTHEGLVHLVIRSLATPLMLWGVSAVTKALIRFFVKER